MPRFIPAAPRLALLFTAFLLAGTAATPAAVFAQATAVAEKPATMADMPEVKNAETYLNALRTMKARFVQTDNNGQRLTGEFLLKRPGRMRFEYDPPMKDFIVADGTFVHYYDAQMKQQSSAPIGRSLANFFLRADIGFTKDLRIEAVQRDDSKRLHITLTQAKDPLAGSITLIFTESTAGALALSGWRVLDPQGLTTDITLEDAQAGIRLGNDLFHYYDPKLKGPRYN
ncbi:MAG: outer membrane lipoprotein carrier protein LolA [Alphaproteobacteria bacterium]|nr:outer membrane lipoprotein carrier protein LolA [Alphaproteobacteria bacterium]